MMMYAVTFTPEAEEQLASLYRYIADKASPETAEDYTSAIVTYCEEMHTFPHRGRRRDDVRSGMRITNYKGRTVIAFAVDDSIMTVSVIGVYYGGRDYEADLEN